MVDIFVPESKFCLKNNTVLMLFKIQSWLHQPKVWRFVCFCSSIVGLVCYAFSSFFNHLIGDWSWWKIFLYTVFSFLISLSTLFAKTWQYSNSRCLEAHTAFSILLITSVYSFFLDKDVKQRPDVYSLVSYVAFAIMSLGLSRLSQLGFEVDLLYFFCALLTVQLMKVKLWLVTVGGAFSYSLILLRSNLDPQPRSGYHGLQHQDHVVVEIGSHSQPQGVSHSVTPVNSPQSTIASSQPHPVIDMAWPSTGTTHTASRVVSTPEGGAGGVPPENIDDTKECFMSCIEALKKESESVISTIFMHVDKYLKANILSRDKISESLPVTDFDIVIDALPSGKVNELREIAKRMVAGGLGKECSNVYSSCRREFLEESVSRLGLMKLSIEDVEKMTWEDLKDEIEKWIKASNVALKVLFPSERRLCDRVFFGFASVVDFTFMEVCRGSAIQLLDFANAVAVGSRSPEWLFSILDVFETLRDLIPEFEALFSDQLSISLRHEVITIWKRLGESIRGIFMGLENLVRRDPAKTAVPGGGLHPITRYVMNYLRAACRSRQSLEQAFDEYGLKEYPKLDDRAHSSSSLSEEMNWIMELLESNLEAKSKIYKDPALCYVFLMNNGRYIVQKAKDSELGILLGDDWIRKHAAKVQQFHMHYQRSSWGRVLGILNLDSTVSLPPNALARSLKEKLKSFNTMFDYICKEQSSWFVFDEQLREEIRISREKILLPAYVNFIVRFQNVSEIGKDADKYIKYVTEDIHAKLNELCHESIGK